MGKYVWLILSIMVGAIFAQNATFDPKKWPLSEPSKIYPFTVRFLKENDRDMAKKVKAYFEHSWRIEIDKLGFKPPMAYDPNGKNILSICISRQTDTGVEGVRPVKTPGVWWDAYESYISVNAWGNYGGAILDSTIAHEFNHASHAAYDWYESPGFFEASATYIQDKVFPNDNDYIQQIIDFQQRPDWPIDYNDNYKTWFMYGACLYLFFLEDRYFAHDATFLAKIWEKSRNAPRPVPPGKEIPDPKSNEPDWVDALEKLLPQNKSFSQTVVEFARWRFYTGDHADGKHFHDAHLQKSNGGVRIAGKLSKTSISYSSLGPMLLGTEYIEIKRPNNLNKLTIKLKGDSKVAWSVQAVPGLKLGSDGDIINVKGKAVVHFGNLQKRFLVITAIPLDGKYDPDTQVNTRYPFKLELTEK